MPARREKGLGAETDRPRGSSLSASLCPKHPMCHWSWPLLRGMRVAGFGMMRIPSDSGSTRDRDGTIPARSTSTHLICCLAWHATCLPGARPMNRGSKLSFRSACRIIARLLPVSAVLAAGWWAAAAATASGVPRVVGALCGSDRPSSQPSGVLAGCGMTHVVSSNIHAGARHGNFAGLRSAHAHVHAPSELSGCLSFCLRACRRLRRPFREQSAGDE
jgi:hypothetical protein